jgi:hypothetical protein
MFTDPLVAQIADQLASARCEQDLDNELSNIPEQHWHLFVESMFASIQEMEAKEPQRAQAMRGLMHTYLTRWHQKKRSGPCK